MNKQARSKMLNICLDTSAYSLPSDVILVEEKRRMEDQNAIFRIKTLAEKQIVKLFISGNVHNELRKSKDIEKRIRINEFWKSVKPQIIPQEIGLNGILVRIGGDREYQDAISKEEFLLSSLKDKTPDSSILLNARFFGMIPITVDYRRIKKIKSRLGIDFEVMTPSDFLKNADL